MNEKTALDELSAEIDDALALLDDYAATLPAAPVTDSFPSLLDQCEAMCAAFAGPEPVRSLHHLACTGGTLIAKCLAALPGVVLLNEIDPLSRLRLADPRSKPPFAPTDLFISLHQSLRRVDESVIADGFRAAVGSVAAGLSRKGQILLIRDHAHSHFCARVDPAGRPSLHEILSADRAPLSAVTIRHPLDSFASLHREGWIHFTPQTLAEYSLRYMAFLDRHADLPVLRYEDFVADPGRELENLCRILKLPFHPAAIELIPIIRVSGDSGRASAQIAPRPRRDLPEEIAAQRGSYDYLSLCRRLDYEP